MKLYVLPPSPRAFKVTALRNHLGLDCETQIVDLGKGDQLTPEYVAMNPNRKMPVLEDDGFVLWESNAILFYLASKKPQSGRWPSDLKRQADVLRWLVLCPINKFTDALEFVEYRVGGGSPGEGPLVGVVMSHVGIDLPDQFADVAERAAANRLLGDKREPALDLVEPA
jgi:glutathione S-transferase